MGRHGLPLARQREAPGRQRISLADPPQEAEGQADAEAHRTGEWDQVEGAGCRRACVRAREGRHGPGRAHDRSGPSPGEDRARQPGLQHEAGALAHRAPRHAIAEYRTAGRPGVPKRLTDFHLGKTPPRTALHSRLRTGFLEVSNRMALVPDIDRELAVISIRETVSGHVGQRLDGVDLRLLDPAKLHPYVSGMIRSPSLASKKKRDMGAESALYCLYPAQTGNGIGP